MPGNDVVVCARFSPVEHSSDWPSSCATRATIVSEAERCTAVARPNGPSSRVKNFETHKEGGGARGHAKTHRVPANQSRRKECQQHWRRPTAGVGPGRNECQRRPKGSRQSRNVSSGCALFPRRGATRLLYIHTDGLAVTLGAGFLSSRPPSRPNSSRRVKINRARDESLFRT